MALKMTDLDPVKASLVVGTVALFVLLCCNGILVWHNRQSRTLALAGGALLAASVLLVTQILYELQTPPEPQRDLIVVDYTIDRLTPQIRSWKYASGLITRNPKATWRLQKELAASASLVLRDPGAFSRDGTRLSEDFARFSLLSFLVNTQVDWQLKTRHFAGTMGHSFSAQPGSAPGERTTLKSEVLQHLLVGTGNMFAGGLTADGGEIWLPPKTSIALSTSTLTLTNPFCQIAVTLESSGGVLFTVPGEHGRTEQLPSAQPRYETRTLGFIVTATYFKLRAQSPDMPKYRTWAENCAVDLSDWFRSA
jgi:hypothetical protein